MQLSNRWQNTGNWLLSYYIIIQQLSLDQCILPMFLRRLKQQSGVNFVWATGRNDLSILLFSPLLTQLCQVLHNKPVWSCIKSVDEVTASVVGLPVFILPAVLAFVQIKGHRALLAESTQACHQFHHCDL